MKLLGKQAVFCKMARCFLPLCCVLLLLQPSQAETKTANLLYSDGGQLAVLFQFDQEIVDLILISPSGQEFSQANPALSVVEGNLWATYQILQAEEGQWQVAYDLGRNSSIDFSRVDVNAGIWLQYVQVSQVDSSSAELNLAFLAESQDTQGYSYQVYGCSALGEEILLATGSAEVGQEEQRTLSIASLSSGRYTLRVDVSYDNGVLSVFDSFHSDSFSYVSNRESDALDYWVDVELDTGLATLRWDTSGYESFFATVTDQDAIILYQGELEAQSNQLVFFFSDTVTELNISLRGRKNGVLSQETWKNVALAGGYHLEILTAEVTNVRQGEVSYQVADNTSLFLQQNQGDPTEFRVEQGGTIAWNLEEGQNTIVAWLQAPQQVVFSVKKEIFCDWIPPTIQLFEDMDGLRMEEKTISLLGKVSFGESLTINGVGVSLEADGTFQHQYELELGENKLTLVATDENGNSSTQVITLYYGSTASAGAGEAGNQESGLGDVLSLFPLFATGILGLALAVMLEIQRNKQKQGGSLPLFAWTLYLAVVAGAVAGYCFLDYYRQETFRQSLEFLTLAEFSTQDAMDFLANLDVAKTRWQGVALASVGLFLGSGWLWHKGKQGGNPGNFGHSANGGKPTAPSRVRR